MRENITGGAQPQGNQGGTTTEKPPTEGAGGAATIQPPLGSANPEQTNGLEALIQQLAQQQASPRQEGGAQGINNLTLPNTAPTLPKGVQNKKPVANNGKQLSNNKEDPFKNQRLSLSAVNKETEKQKAEYSSLARLQAIAKPIMPRKLNVIEMLTNAFSLLGKSVKLSTNTEIAFTLNGKERKSYNFQKMYEPQPNGKIFFETLPLEEQKAFLDAAEEKTKSYSAINTGIAVSTIMLTLALTIATMVVGGPVLPIVAAVIGGVSIAAFAGKKAYDYYKSRPSRGRYDDTSKKLAGISTELNKSLARQNSLINNLAKAESTPSNEKEASTEKSKEASKGKQKSKTRDIILPDEAANNRNRASRTVNREPTQHNVAPSGPKEQANGKSPMPNMGEEGFYNDQTFKMEPRTYNAPQYSYEHTASTETSSEVSDGIEPSDSASQIGQPQYQVHPPRKIYDEIENASGYYQSEISNLTETLQQMVQQQNPNLENGTNEMVSNWVARSPLEEAKPSAEETTVPIAQQKLAEQEEKPQPRTEEAKPSVEETTAPIAQQKLAEQEEKPQPGTKEAKPSVEETTVPIAQQKLADQEEKPQPGTKEAKPSVEETTVPIAQQKLAEQAAIRLVVKEQERMLQKAQQRANGLRRASKEFKNEQDTDSGIGSMVEKYSNKLKSEKESPNGVNL